MPWNNRLEVLPRLHWVQFQLIKLEMAYRNNTQVNHWKREDRIAWKTIYFAMFLGYGVYAHTCYSFLTVDLFQISILLVDEILCSQW